MQLLSHLTAVVSPRRSGIAGPCWDRGCLRPGGTRLSLFVNRAALRSAKDVTQSHRPCHLAEVPLAEAGFTVRLTVDSRSKTLLVIEVSQLEPCR